jgi:shikimate dehydrogenase
MPRVGLLGWPVAHSVSPAMQNAAFHALGLPWRYELLPTPPDALAVTLAGLAEQGFCGANVTVPHKETVVAHLDRIEGVARATGAVNTLLERDGAWVGTNTDAAGFLAALRQAGFEPAGRQALILGAGGGARAVVYALGQAGCTCLVYNRTRARARRLVDELSPRETAEVRPGLLQGRDFRSLLHDSGSRFSQIFPDSRHLGAGQNLGSLASRDNATTLGGPGTACPTGPATVVEALAGLEPDRLDLLVNATPVGQWPDPAPSPWPEALPLPSHWTVFDLVYNPAETRLLARARAAGATPVGGLEMLVQQGALGFHLWTGREAPLEVMRAAARQALGREEA